MSPGDLATKQQRAAADPEANVWVSASAGTGKTKVLTDRILNLLLNGTKPQRLLCLTFTNAAAGEMANRLQHKLSIWATASNKQLIDELTQLTGQSPQPNHLKIARCLFTDVLDTPGGLKIMTIHAFCQSILRQFPIEANLSPHFQVIDEQMARSMLRDAQHIMLNQPTCTDITNHLSLVTRSMDETRFEQALADLLAKKTKLPSTMQLLDYKKWVERTLETDLSYEEKQLEEQILKNAPKDSFFQFIESFKAGSAVDQKKAIILITLRDGEPNLQAYIELFLTDKGELRKAFATKKVLTKNPEIENLFTREAERIQSILSKITALQSGKLSFALTALSAHIIEIYESLKQEQNLLDYEDLIVRTSALLKRTDVAPWILYKLDGGLDHILVDEAQDTNEQQWSVIADIAHEFFSGQSRHQADRTLFVVGDEKQSIYSFQGADPAVFDVMAKTFRRAAHNACQAWRDIALNISFRSTKAVLDTVDAVFTDPEIRKGVISHAEWQNHQAFRQGEAGHVEQWPLVTQEVGPPIQAWEPPVQPEQRRRSASAQLAMKIAQQIHQWLTNKELLTSHGRPIQPGDIMILVQRRNQFVDDLVRELKSRRIPIAGSDRLKLKEHLSVQDLIALARFACLPEDDLNLANVLKGPFINISEDDLFDLCYQRHGCLWENINNKRVDLSERLKRILRLAGELNPYQFFHHMLDICNGRQSILTRLGQESQDYLDEFLNTVLAFEKGNIASLQHFLHWFDSADIDIKREQDAQSNVIRIMTVHGAKGLQAPIVFLPDTVQMPTLRSGLYWYSKKPLWMVASPFKTKKMFFIAQEAETITLQEYRRLLYVAMTRAEDRLYICGYTGQRGLSEKSWYHTIRQGLVKIGNKQEDLLTYSCLQEVPTRCSDLSSPSMKPRFDVPDWLQHEVNHMPAEQQVSFKKPLSDAAIRGTLIHKLLQYLPSVPVGDHEYIGMQMLNAYDGADKADLISTVQQVLDNPDISFIFSNHALAEVPIKAWKDSQMFNGQIDRLVFLDDKILIIDFKTTQTTPDSELLHKYHMQLFAYKSAVEKLYPGIQVDCAILWVDANKLEYIKN